MTMPAEPEVITRLRKAVSEYDDWPALNRVAVIEAVIDAARALVREHDNQRAAVEALLNRPMTAEQVRSQFGLPRIRVDEPPATDRAKTVCTCQEARPHDH